MTDLGRAGGQLREVQTFSERPPVTLGLLWYRMTLVFGAYAMPATATFDFSFGMVPVAAVPVSAGLALFAADDFGASRPWRGD